MQVVSNRLLRQERLTCWNMERPFRQNYKWQASLCPFHERFFCWTLKPESSPSPWYTPHTEEDGGEWGRRELRLTSRWTGESDVGVMEWKSAAAQFSPGHLGITRSLPSLPAPWHPQPPLAKQKHVLCFSAARLDGSACEARRALHMFYNLSTGATLNP